MTACERALPPATADRPGAWVFFHWLTDSSGVHQARRRIDGDVDVRRLWPDEFGRRRWERARACPIAYWRNEACTCAQREVCDV